MGWSQAQGVQIYRSFDMGYSPDPAICLWIAHLGNRFIVFKEKLWFKTIVEEIARDMKTESEGLRITTTFCDPTIDFHTGHDARSLRDIFEENGVPMEPSINNRERYAASVHSALATEVSPNLPLLQIHGPSCPYLVKTIPQMQYNPKRPLAMDDHRHDHAVVALAYFLISSGAMERHGMPSSPKAKKWLTPKPGNNNVLGRESVRD